MVELFTYFLIFLVGLSLSLLGSGGSILIIPILVYILHLSSQIAIFYSLFIIGLSSFFGFYLKRKDFDLKLSFLFLLFSIPSVIITRILFLPLIPEIINLGFLSLSKDKFLMIIFSLIMFFAGFSMYKRESKTFENKKYEFLDIKKVVLSSSFVGIITALTGAGGGFLIIPALVIYLNLDMKKAISNSLFIIFINSLIAFLSSFREFGEIDLILLLTLTLISTLGIFIGNLFSKKVNAKNLKKLFAYFVITLSIIIFLREVLF